MAVEKSKVISRFRIKFPKVNLSNDRLNEIADRLSKKPADDADDAAIDLVLDEANELLSFEDIAKSDDRLKNAEALAKKNNPTPPAPVPNPEPKPNPEPPKGDDMPAWAKAILDSNKKLEGELEAIKTGKIIETKKQTASELFAKSEVLNRIPEAIRQNWVNRIDVNSEIPFEEQIKSLEEEYSTLVQVSADSGRYAPPAGGGNPNPTIDEKLVEKLVDEL